jgi:hypothetical protein
MVNTVTSTTALIVDRRITHSANVSSALPVGAGVDKSIEPHTWQQSLVRAFMCPKPHNRTSKVRPHRGQ